MKSFDKKKKMLEWNNMENFDNDEIHVTKVSVEYSQPGDCCEDRDLFQTLTLTTEDGGGGPFIRMKTGTDDSRDSRHWSISDLDDLRKVIDDFEMRVYYKEHYGNKKENDEHQVSSPVLDSSEDSLSDY